MISFVIGIIILIAGYFVWGRITEKIFDIRSNNKTPAVRLADNIDYVEMNWKKCMLIQLLNIAGTGPIFGAITGAMFGPAAFAWIVFGCIFIGAVHDYMLGMISVRNDGKNLSELVGKYLGKFALYAMRLFCIIILIFVGVVFIYTPAQVLQIIFLNNSQLFYYLCIGIIIIYYLIATVLPIDKLIGRLYPVFGICLLIMSAGLIIMMFITGNIKNIPEFNFINMRPDKTKNITANLFPFMFITIACGAISGFHATQSPIIARCLKNEKDGRKVFYLAMILEGIIAMIWAAITLALPDTVGVKALIYPAEIVATQSINYLGKLGSVLAIFGIVACPITSGDTAFRAARLSISEIIKLDQKKIKNRFIIAVPIFILAIILVRFAIFNAKNFNIMWRYFGWSNQTLATIGLWTASAFLAKTYKNYLITLVPAIFMTVIIISYFFASNECLGLIMTKIFGANTYINSIAIGIIFAVLLLVIFIFRVVIKSNLINKKL